MDRTIAQSDVLIVGAGIVGLAHACAAVARGQSVTVIDRDARAVGASVRNFGHCCITAQAGQLHALALVAREKWLSHAARAGFFAVESGALTIARSAAEIAVLEELAASRDPGEVELLTAEATTSHLRAGADPAIVGGALLRDDLRVDPRSAVSTLARWLAEQPSVTMLWQTSYLGASDGVAATSRGAIRADRTLVCVGHDFDYLYPDLARSHEIQRCALHMLRVDAPPGLTLGPVVLTGTSMLRYPAFAGTEAAGALRAELTAARADLLEIGANVMFTQRPDGSLIIGDSHRYSTTMEPFQSERASQLLVDEIARILGVDALTITERWQGIYASSPQASYVREEIAPGVTAVSVTSGVGMTISFGIAEATFA